MVVTSMKSSNSSKGRCILVANYPRKYLRRYQSHSKVWEWKITRGHRVFLRDVRSHMGRTLVIVDFGEHDVHKRFRRGCGKLSVDPKEYELLTA